MNQFTPRFFADDNATGPRTIKLRIAQSGSLSLANPSAAAGPDHRVYAIHNVPADVTAAQCVTQIGRICLAHGYADPAAYDYDWSDVGHLHAGAIVNRYRDPTTY